MKKILLAILIVAVVLIATCGFIVYFNTGAGNIRISVQTTRVLGPLDAHGFVDFAEAFNERAGKDVAPENNAVIPLLRAIGPEDINSQTRGEFFRRLGMEALPEKGNYFVRFDLFVQRHPDLAPKPNSDRSDPNQNDDEERDIDGSMPNEAIAEEAEDLSYTQFELAGARPWSRDEFPLVAAWLNANELPLKHVTEASRRAKLYWPRVRKSSETMLLAVDAPPIQMSREISRALIIRAMLRLHENQLDAGWDDILAACRLSRLFAQDDILISELVAVALSFIANEGAISYAEFAPIGRDRAMKMIADLQQLLPFLSTADVLDSGERLYVLDAVVSLAKTGEFGEFAGAYDAEFSMALVDWNVPLENLKGLMDRAVAAMREPTFQQREDAAAKLSADLEDRVRNMELGWRSLRRWISIRQMSEDLGDVLGAILLSADLAVNRAETRGRTYRELAILAIALAAFHHDRGEYPAALADLTPDYLDGIPLDPFTEKDLRYEKTDDGYLLYSFGQNMKDDGGIDADDEADRDDYVVRVPSKRENDDD